MAKYTVNVKEEDIIKSFSVEYSPAEMLIVNKALRLMSKNGEVHEMDRDTAKKLSEGLSLSLRAREKQRVVRETGYKSATFRKGK